ncbi:MAG: hypothetical protein V2A66_07325 [Pseudomonadota bacterium]
MAKIKICKEPDCQNAATTEGYCRLHYLRNWKHIKEDSRRRAAKKLNRYIDHVIQKHPDRYIDVIKKDLRSPLFDRYVEETFGCEEGEDGQVLDEPSYEEEIEQLIRQLKVEKGF